MRLLIADDHRIVREGLRMLLAREEDIEIVGEAADGQEVLALVTEQEPDVVLLDVRMPGMGGLEVLETLRAAGDDVRIIVLSMHDDPAYVKRAIELGADGYLLKSVGREELLRALHTVADGGPYIQGEIAAPLVARIVDPAAAGPVGDLSVRDVEILQMLADGADNRAIAARLGISEAAVKAELRTIYSRLEVKRRSEAVAVALRLGLIS